MLLVRKGIYQTPEMDETEGFECLGHFNWTICSSFSPAGGGGLLMKQRILIIQENEFIEFSLDEHSSLGPISNFSEFGDLL